MLKPTEKIWHNGAFIPWGDAKIHVLSHVVHYGSSVFEGVRCYATPAGPAVFRLKEHTRRLYDSAKIYRMPMDAFTQEQVNEATLELIRVNQMASCYIRPVVFRGYNEMGVNPMKNPVEFYMACWEWGKYLGEEALASGVDVCISSWTRLAPNTNPTLAKAGGNYLNSQLIKMEALANGYSEGIALDSSGYVSEGSGENLFVVRDGKIITPPLGASVLPGITRDTVLTLARDLGVGVVEGLLPREMLYIADEVFFSGTAAEITPIRSIDKQVVGKGRRGPVAEAVQKRFFDIIEGRAEDKYRWLTPALATANVG
jgi:branched-chain amino acid aminotransferase